MLCSPPSPGPAGGSKTSGSGRSNRARGSALRAAPGPRLQISLSPASQRRRPIRGPSRRAALGSRNKSLQRPGASRSVRAARKHSGSPRSEDLPSVALNTPTGALLRTSHRSPFHHRSINISKIPCKFPANSLLPQKNSLLGFQKFPAPLRREFGCKPMDSLAEWRRKLANEPKIFKNSLQIPC